MDLETIRREYLKDGLDFHNLDDSPIIQFELWMKQAISSGIQDPTAMVLATANEISQPSQRIVLLKKFDDKGFVFYTNYGSKKARDIAENESVSLLFPWYFMERQIHVSGVAEKLTEEESASYFRTRPRESQLAAWASEQSKKIVSRDYLISEYNKIEQKYQDSEVPLPAFWGGYRVKPSEMEFWQGGANRLHDRFRYKLTDTEWSIFRLAP